MKKTWMHGLLLVPNNLHPAIEYRAHLFGGLAVYQHRGRWNIAHQNSGCFMGRETYKTAREAKVIAERIADVVDWTLARDEHAARCLAMRNAEAIKAARSRTQEESSNV